MLKKDININRATTTVWVLSFIILEKSLTGRKPPEEIRVKAKLSELNDLIENIFKIINIIKVRLEYKKKIFKACLKISELSNDI